MPRILFVTPGCFDKGGISRYSRYQMRAIREIYGSDSVKVLSLLPPASGGFEQEVAVNWSGSGNGFGGKLGLARQLLQNTLKWKPDLIHIAHVNFSAMAVVIARLAGAKTLLNTYGLEVWSNPSRDAIWGLKACGHVIADCHSTAQYIESERLRPQGSVPVIWDCVDLEQFNPSVEIGSVVKQYGIPDPAQHQIVLTLGRLANEAMHKGYDRLLRTFVAVQKECSNSRLVIAGRGNATESLARLAEELGIADFVVFPGSIDDSDLASVYRTATVFSLVSDRGHGRGEGIPLTPLEAMACGVPIIVGNHDGSKEAVVNETNGFVIDPFDLQDHSQKLIRILKDSALQENQSRAAWEVASANFSFDQFKSDHETLYARILGQSKERSELR